jgi:type I restriction enzyme S subunit
MLSARNIQNRRINFDEFRFISDEDFAVEHARTNVQPGDVLLTIVGAIGRSAVVPTGLQQFALQRSVAVLKPLLIESRYLNYALQSPDIQKYLDENAKGTAQRGIYLKALSGVEIPLAPLNEQKRITDKLDALLTRVDACRERLERVPLILRRLRQAVLAAAISGQLTEKFDAEWSGNISKDAVLLNQVIAQVKTGPFGSTLHKSDYKPGSIPVVNPMHINNGIITPSANMAISKAKAKELSDFRLHKGDVIIARRGVMGRCAVVGQKEDGWLCGTGSMILRPMKKLLPEYLQIFLSSPETVEALEAGAVGSTMVNLNQKILLNLKIRVPHIAEQRKIVHRVESLLDYADRLEARYRAAHAYVEQLTPALLTKAFRGELVPQDPKDEPASVLLERIRASRAVSEGALKVRGGGNVQTKTASSTRKVKKSKAKIIMLKRKDVEPSHLSSILKANGPLSAEALWSASQLDIDEFYDQLKDEEARELLRETIGEQRLLEAA